ncbi:MAG: hypothetical protein E6K06_05395 [Methanobacteriota archaeon]|nr:MAG: hypothetical protein E6K09_01460 [Euryarchaeota archaeon]TLZ71952.1 MAG: hypothetical protein E6K06_05395 [Euryarchaeota archaeon]
MATINESPHVDGPWSAAVVFLRRAWKFLWPPAGSLAETVPDVELTLVGRIRKFLWLSSGLFSAASFAIPAIGLFAYGTTEGMGTNFVAAVVSACLFGVTSLLHFGPNEA